LTGAFGVALISNLINNLPVGLIGANALELAHIPVSVKNAFLIGVDLGPNLSVTGSLKTILWLWLFLLIDVTTFHKARAQGPGGPQVPPASFQTTVVQGVVAQYLMNPDGFVDGLLLSNNTIIRFPPHLGQVLTQTVSPQDIVRVEGFFESSGTFHASSIIDLQSQRTVADYPPPPGHPPPPRPGSLPPAATQRERHDSSSHSRKAERNQWRGARRWDSRTLCTHRWDAVCRSIARRKPVCGDRLRNE
jgi:hypothetical protein